VGFAGRRWAQAMNPGGWTLAQELALRHAMWHTEDMIGMRNGWRRSEQALDPICLEKDGGADSLTEV